MKLLVVPAALGDSLSEQDCLDQIEGALAQVGLFASSHALSSGGPGMLNALMSHGTVELHGFDIPISENEHHFAIAARRRGTWWLEGSTSTGGMDLTNVRQSSTATSYGLGELIARCMRRQPAPLIVGLPDRFPVDGGLGIMMSLGFTVSDAWGHPIKTMGGIIDLGRVRHIHGSPIPSIGPMRVLIRSPRTVDAALDAYHRNPPERLHQIDALRRWVDTLNEWRAHQGLRTINPHQPNLGSGSGSAIALSALGGVLTDGAQYFSRVTGLKKVLENVDAVIVVHDGTGDRSATESIALVHSRLGLSAPCPVFALAYRPNAFDSTDSLGVVCLTGLAPEDFATAAQRLNDRLHAP